MLISASKFAESRHIAYSTVRRYLKRGYYGDVQRFSEHTYLLPADMIDPYVTTGRITKPKMLVDEFLDSATKGNSIHPNMYKSVPKAQYDAILNCIVENQLVIRMEPFPGVTQLGLKEAGNTYLKMNHVDQVAFLNSIGI